MKEIWKPIIGYEGLYEISNFARVKRLRRYKSNHSKMQFIPECILKQTIMNNGYLSVGISLNCKRKCFLVHRLLAIHFIPNPNNYSYINHIDGNKLNNNLDNLEWCTQQYNVIHSYNNNLNKRKKKVNQYDLNGNFIKTWDSVTEAQKYYKNSSISAVCLNKRKSASGFIWKYF